MFQRLRVNFGVADSGSLPVMLTATNQQLTFVASYIPYDSLNDLVASLTVLLNADGSTSVIWNTEPTEYDFLFTAKENEITLTVTEFPSARRTSHAGSIVFTVQASRRELVLIFWRALRNLRTQQAFEQHWKREFPDAAMEQLTAKLS